MMERFIYLIIIAALTVSCGQKKAVDKGFGEIPDSVLNQGLQVSQQAMSEIVDNLSSPVEMAALLKKVGAPFSQNNLADPNNISRFTTENQQALSLGVYGANLGYLNIYNKKVSVVNYLTAIKSLSENLKIGQFFDFTTLKRLAQNESNLDSLIFISVHSFNEMDSYLRDNKRGNLSALMVTGVWIEGLHMATTMYAQKPNKELAERIGEQKIVLSDLLLVLKNYDHDEYFKDLINQLDPLKNLFNEVKITYEMGEPEMVEENGMLVIKQNEKSLVNITPKELDSIIATTKQVRDKLMTL